jgi:endo-1,4-beta-D-glucanase Y
MEQTPMKMPFALLSIVLATSIAFSANYPFPQNTVNFGIRATTAASSDLQSVFDQWKKSFYEESGTEARIKWDDVSKTVSEGIGYGMMIMACMDNSQNATQDEFDKLWSYYKKWRNGNGVMNWKINGFANVEGQNGATDGDLDAAAGLVLAYRQWGDEKYRTDARELITNIWDHEVNADKYLKPGDAWDTKKNPSYFSTGALESFKSLDSHDWDAVIKNSYALIKKVQNSSSGLVPDWCSQDGNTQEGEFGYDAVRTPWRIAWAYAWYGHKDASDICGKMATWVRSATNNDPAAIKIGYTRSGSAQSTNSNATYTGCLSCACMVSADNQDFVNKGFTATKNADASSYYNKTLQVLTMLMISGNMTAMSGSPVKSLQPTSMSYSIPYRILTVPLVPVSGRYYSLTGRRLSKEDIPPQPLLRIR